VFAELYKYACQKAVVLTDVDTIAAKLGHIFSICVSKVLKNSWGRLAAHGYALLTEPGDPSGSLGDQQPPDEMMFVSVPVAY
jgi:hypothetical protein